MTNYLARAEQILTQQYAYVKDFDHFHAIASELGTLHHKNQPAIHILANIGAITWHWLHQNFTTNENVPSIHQCQQAEQELKNDDLLNFVGIGTNFIAAQAGMRWDSPTTVKTSMKLIYTQCLLLLAKELEKEESNNACK